MRAGGEQGERSYGSKAARRVLRVLKHLGSGAILEWQSLREIGAALRLTENEVYGALADLVSEGLAEKSERGFRQSPQGLSAFAVAAQEELARAAARLGYGK